MLHAQLHYDNSLKMMNEIKQLLNSTNTLTISGISPNASQELATLLDKAIRDTLTKLVSEELYPYSLKMKEETDFLKSIQGDIKCQNV